MTLSVAIGGTEVATTGLLVVPESGLVDVTSCADGSTGDSLLRVDDPDGSLSFTQWDQVVIEEDACTPSRCFTGYVYQAKISRGPYDVGAGRIWELQVVDLNALLSWRVLRGAGAKRPAETGSERLAWLLTTPGMSGVVFDNGLVLDNAWEYDEADYRGQYAYDVLNSIISASAVNRWLFFLYWDSSAASGEEISLFYNDVGATTYDSTMKISNVASDAATLVVAPWKDADLTIDGTNIESGVFVDSEAGQFYRERTATVGTYGVRRDGVMSSVRINNATTASRHIDTYLDVHSGPTDTITCVVRLPRAQVNLIDAGMRLPVRFSHLPGYTDSGFTNVRVGRRAFTFAPGRNTHYDLKLTLTNRGVNQSGGGEPGDFPAPPPVVAGPCGTSATYLHIPSGASSSPETVHIESGQYVYVLRINIDCHWLGTSEWSLWLPRPSDDPDSPSFTVQEILKIIPTYPDDLTSVGTWQSPDMFGDPEMNVGFVYPVQEGHGVFRGVASNDFEHGYFQADETGDYHLRGGNAVGDGYFANIGYTANVCIVVSDLPPESFSSPDLDENVDPTPPTQGQPTVPAAPNETPDGSTTVFTTAFPYATNTLHVTFNGQELTRGVDFTESDPATGEFTFTHAPPTGSEILVWYQGR